MQYLVDTAQQIARVNQPDPEYVPTESQCQLTDVSNYIEETAAVTMEDMVEVEKEELISALKRVSLISSTIRLKISEEGVTLISESREVGEGSEKISSNYSGEETNIAFNSRFFEDGITSIDGDKVVLAISEPLKPGIVKEKEGEDFMYIIMPIRL